MFGKLDLYIIKKFLGTYVFSIILIISIAVVFDVSEKIDDFIEKDAPLNAILFDYYLNYLDYQYLKKQNYLNLILQNVP